MSKFQKGCLLFCLLALLGQCLWQTHMANTWRDIAFKWKAIAESRNDSGPPAGTFLTSKGTYEKPTEGCQKMHWKHARYFDWEPKSVKDSLICDDDGRSLVTISYANPSSSETWSVCSDTTGDCYGDYVDKASAVKRAESLSYEISKHK